MLVGMKRETRVRETTSDSRDSSALAPGRWAQQGLPTITISAEQQGLALSSATACDPFLDTSLYRHCLARKVSGNLILVTYSVGKLSRLDARRTVCIPDMAFQASFRDIVAGGLLSCCVWVRIDG